MPSPPWSLTLWGSPDTSYSDYWSSYGNTADIERKATSLSSSAQDVYSLLINIRNSADDDSYWITPEGPIEEIDISSDGCIVSKKPLSYNCTATCFSPSDLFVPANLGDCMLLAAAASLIQNDTLRLNTSDSYTASAVKDFALGNFSAWDGNQIIQDVVDCAVASCGDRSLGQCSGGILDLQGVKANASNIENITAILSEYCSGFGTTVNPDIAGPGVVVSYILQTAIAIFFYSIIQILMFLPQLIKWSFKIWTVWRRRKGRQGSPTWLVTNRALRRIGRSRAVAATISSMVEFQEVQGYFVAAIQFATLATFRPDASETSATNFNSYGMAITSSRIIQTLAVYGILPVLLIQSSLQRAGMRWWYTLCITFLVFTLGLVVKGRAGKLIPNFDTLWDYFKAQNSVDECGGNPNPMTYCDVDFLYLGAAEFSLWAAYIAMPSLVIDQLAWTLKGKALPLPSRVHRLLEHDWMYRLTEWKIWHLVATLYWTFLQVTLLVFVIYYFRVLIEITGFVGMGSDSWTYGQLIAVMVWAPVIAKYAYCNLFGIEEGFGRRLAQHYHVVHDEDDSDLDDPINSLHHERSHQKIELKGNPDRSSYATIADESTSGAGAHAPSLPKIPTTYEDFRDASHLLGS